METAILTTHYGNPLWVKLLMARVRAAFPEITDDHIYVIDQDRTDDSESRLRTILGPVNILRYPVSKPHFEVTGHDHAYVLNQAVRQIQTDTLVIFDSDAHPVTTDVGMRIQHDLQSVDAILAADSPNGAWSHPCFMTLGPGVDRRQIFFDAEQLEHGMDTGRKVYEQIVALGLQAELLRPTRAFGGLWGSLYLDDSVYHHGSGSFNSHTDPRFVRQVASWRREERLFRRKVIRGTYTVTPLEARVVRESRRLRRARARTQVALRRRLGAQ